MSNLVKRMGLRRANTTLAALPWMPRAILPHPEPRALSSARPTPLLRASWFALLALALCGALLLMATPASAQQTVVTLVSNTGQSLDSSIGLTTGFPGDAQAFTTGSNASGYTLDSIGIHFRNISPISAAADDLTATLNADNSGEPGDVLCTLTDPATFTGSGVQTFDAPSSGTTCSTLAASTTYFAVVTLESDPTGSYNFEITTSTSDDSGAATGWSIADKAFYLSGTTWTLFNGGALEIEVKGFNAVVTPGVTVSESAIAVTEGGATDTYTVVLDTAPTGDVTIAVTETSDDISLSATTLTFGTANWSTAQIVTVTAVDDSIAEGDETVTITHSVSASADTTDYPTTLTVDSVDVTVTDNDTTTFVSNLGQTGSTTVGDLSAIDLAQRFDTGSTASFDFTEVEVLFKTTPGSSATVTAIIADGLGSTDNIVATLTNPSTWSTNARFGIPDGTTLSKNTTYYLIIEATDGQLQTTDSNADDSGAAANWYIGVVASVRTMVSDTGLGGTWANAVTNAALQMAIRGTHHGNPGTPELAVTAKDQTLVLDVTVPDHGSSDLTDIEYRYKETAGGAYTSWTPVTEAISNSGGTFEIGGLTNGTEYTAQVQTVNDIGTSGPSNEDSATPDAPPAVTSVAITSDAGADNTYAIGDDIVVTLTFDKNIAFSGTGFDPYFYLKVGTGNSKEVSCTIGMAPTKDLVCTYPVVAGDEDSDGVSAGSGTVARSNKLIVGPLGQNAVLTHSALAADSDHKVDGVRPELTGAMASADKTKITLTFSEAIGAVDRTKITFDSGGTTLTTTADSISGSEVEITLTTALTATDTNVTVALAADAVTDAVGNGNAVLAATAIVDETAPTLSMTSTPSNTEVLLTYNEPLDPDSIPGTSAFTVKVGGTARTISTAAASGASGIVLTLSTAFRPGDTLTVSYTVPTLNPIQDIAGNDAAALTDEAVSNTLAATAPEAVASLTASNTSTFGEVQLDWSGGTWANGSAMWVADDSDGKLYAYTLSTGTPDAANTFDLDKANNDDPGGLYGSSSTLWVSNTVTDKVYAYTITAGSSFGTRDTSKEFSLDTEDSLTALIMPMGMWSDDSTMWLVGNVREEIYAYNVGSIGTFGARETAKECSLSSEYSRPNGMWSDGSTIWVADSEEDRIFTYALTSSGCGARQPLREIRLANENSDPWGIWSDGETLWVADDR